MARASAPASTWRARRAWWKEGRMARHRSGKQAPQPGGVAVFAVALILAIG
jgi:hypothetical protein